MRRTCCILATLAIGWISGCATQHPAGPAARLTAPAADIQLASARALTFDPDLPGGVPLNLAGALDRESRQPGAYAGFDSQTISSYQIYQRDDQRIFSDRNGLELHRSTQTLRIGTNYR